MRLLGAAILLLVLAMTPAGAQAQAQAASETAPVPETSSAAAEGAGIAAVAATEDVEAATRNEHAAPAPARNAILISVDSLRADHLALYGYPRVTTPRIDRLALERGATVFSRVAAVAPSCHPSHASMLTGLYPQQVGVPGCGEDYLVDFSDLESEEAMEEFARLQTEMKSQPPALTNKKLSAVMNWISIPDGTETLPTFLHRNGFRTGGFVSIWTLQQRFGYGRGFDVFDDEMPEYYGPGSLSWLFRDAMKSLRRQTTEGTMDRTLAFLSSMEPADRFFVFINLADTHVPYAARDGLPTAGASNERAELEEAWKSRYTSRTYERAMQKMGRGKQGFLLDRYDGAITHTDRQLGRIFDWLEVSGHAQDTVVLITSDHGDSFGQHLYLSERQSDRLFFEHSVHVWEETQHVPMILFDPARPGGVVREDGLVSHVDIVPTILGRLGLETSEFGSGKLAGRDLAEAGPGQRTVFFLTFGRGRPGSITRFIVDYPKFIGFRTGDTKFFVDRDRFKNASAGNCYLYDLAADPNETNNLCTDQASAAKALAFRKRLVDWYGRGVDANRPADKGKP